MALKKALKDLQTLRRLACLQSALLKSDYKDVGKETGRSSTDFTDVGFSLSERSSTHFPTGVPKRPAHAAFSMPFPLPNTFNTP